MRYIFLFFIALSAVLLGDEIQASSSIPLSSDSAGKSAECAASLKKSAIAVSAGGFSVNVFRIFKTYPPLSSEQADEDSDMENSLKSVISLNIHAQCLQPEMYEYYEVHNGSELKGGDNSGLKPLFVGLLKNKYYVLFVRDGYFTGDGEGRELVASIAVFSIEGVLLRKMDRISSWRNYEGTLILLESCVSEAGIVSRELTVDPNFRLKDGHVLSYLSPELRVNQTLYPTAGGYSSQKDGQALSCDWDRRATTQRPAKSQTAKRQKQ